MQKKQNRFLGWFSILILSVLLLGSSIPARASQPAPMNPSNPVPVLAYYYIWYDASSWNRDKIDYPLLGRYSSDDRAVMLQQIQWAKAAGIDGFIVSWKSTDVLNRRLDQLADLAEQQNFKLAVIYEGLDFNRNPLPVSQVASDMDVFITRYAGRPAFQLFAKPLVIWSGTWKYTPEEIAQVTQGRRNQLFLLASERTLAGYAQLANLVDGNAYYWSSVNPDTYPGYEDKLTEMGKAVHQNGGLWIPPAAPGFDARLIGGTTVVDRKNGDTFRSQISTAMQSSPDALGIISWNEFSENSYIEPSVNYGSEYLDILSGIDHLPPPEIGNFDSSESAGIFPEVLPHSRLVAVGGIAILTLFGLVVIARRHV